MKINVVFNRLICDYQNILEILETSLIKRNIDFKSFELEKMGYFGDFTFVIGGDGTLLRAARFYAESGVPVCGINQGRLGFLSQTGVDGFDLLLDTILQNKYTIEKRLMLVSNNYAALNDFVIKGCSHSRTSKFYLEINNNPVCDYIADGIIISTPTGSTAYGLSAGGPVLYPELEAIVIVPICPHTLNVRPLVIPSGEVITIKTGDKPLIISVDGMEQDKQIENITITSHKSKANLVFVNQNSFYSVLRDKLHWGISPEGC